jgi:citrate synthase
LVHAAAERPFTEGLCLSLAFLPGESGPAEILASLPVAISALIRRKEGRTPLAPDPNLSTAADLLRMIRGEAATEVMTAALDAYWTSVIDNGLNTSAYTARIIASSRASLVSAVLGAYCSFTGPLHGGAPGPTLDMLDEAAESGDIDAWIEHKLASGERLMGFGHRVFRHGDPRADELRKALERLGPGAGRLTFAAEVQRCVREVFIRVKPGRPCCNRMSRSTRRCCSTRWGFRVKVLRRCLRLAGVPAGSPMRWNSRKPAD